MTPGTHVALKVKRPELDHRCKGPFFRFCYGGGARFFCFACDSFKVVDKKEIRRVVPKPDAWANLYPDAKIVRMIEHTRENAENFAKPEYGYLNEIAPVYLGRRRKVK